MKQILMLLTFITISQLVLGGDDIFNRQSFDALFGNKEKVAKNLVNIEMFLVKQMHFDYAELLEIDFKEKIDLILKEFKKFGVKFKKKVRWIDGKDTGKIEVDKRSLVARTQPFTPKQMIVLSAAQVDLDMHHGWDNVVKIEQYLLGSGRYSYPTLLKLDFAKKQAILRKFLVNLGGTI